MNDQARKLRQRVKEQQEDRKLAHTIAIISGKGGVGKSNIALNFSINLSQHKKKVLLFDLDIGMGNIDILVGNQAGYTIADFFINNIPLEQVIQLGPEGLHYIAGGSGLEESFYLNEARVNHLLEQMQDYLYEYDYFVFDIGAGISEDLVLFLSSVKDIIVVVTPEPTSIMDAYSAMKILALNHAEVPFHLLGNRMKNEKENKDVLGRLQKVLYKFLNKESNQIGFIPEDSNISTAVKRQTPFILHKPSSLAAKQINKITNIFLNNNHRENKVEKNNSFIEKLKLVLLQR